MIEVDDVAARAEAQAVAYDAFALQLVHDEHVERGRPMPTGWALRAYQALVWRVRLDGHDAGHKFWASLATRQLSSLLWTILESPADPETWS